MSVEITAPVGVLGLFESWLPTRTEVAFERTVAFPGRRGFSIRVSGEGVQAAVDAIRGGRLVEDVSPVQDTLEGRIYRIAMADQEPDLIERIHAADWVVFSASAAGDT